jgi:hypothetical protein
LAGAVALIGPRRQLVSHDHRGDPGVEQDERAVGEILEPQVVDAAPVGAAEEPLGVEPAVDLGRRRNVGIELRRPRGTVGVVALAAAFRAGPMPRGERDRLVVEVQERVVVRLPLLLPAAAELERARDPQIARVETDDRPALVEDSAVSGPPAAERDRLDVTQRRDAVASRSRALGAVG